MINGLHQYQTVAMGGPVDIKLCGLSDRQANALFEQMVQEVGRLENKYSRFRSDSLLSRVNAGELNGQRMDPEMTGLLNYAQQVFELSGGLFDPTVGVLRRVWDFKQSELPNDALLQRCLQHIGWQKLNWDGASLSIPEGMQLDLGGIVKEFAADRLRSMLSEEGVAGLVNLAGDIAASAPPPEQTAWNVAVQHPRRSGAIAQIPLMQGAVAGSGDYERFLEVDGKRYCHILRPDTGYPAIEGLISATVQAESCLMAGSVATVAMLQGRSAKQWLDEFELPYLAVSEQLDVFGSLEVIS